MTRTLILAALAFAAFFVVGCGQELIEVPNATDDASVPDSSYQDSAVVDAGSVD